MSRTISLRDVSPSMLPRLQEAAFRRIMYPFDHVPERRRRGSTKLHAGARWHIAAGNSLTSLLEVMEKLGKCEYHLIEVRALHALLVSSGKHRSLNERNKKPVARSLGRELILEQLHEMRSRGELVYEDGAWRVTITAIQRYRAMKPIHEKRVIKRAA